MEIKEVAVSELFSDPDWADLIQQYTQESGNRSLGREKVFEEGYVAAQKEGSIQVFGAYSDGKLIGLTAVSFTILPHYSKKIGVIDSIFLLPWYRRGSAGLRLIKACALSAKARGCVGLYCTAPVGSRLEQLYSRIANRTDSVFWIDFQE